MKARFGFAYPVRLDELNVQDGVLAAPCRVYSGWSSRNKLVRFIETDLSPLVDDDGSTVQFFLSNTGVPTYRRQGRTGHFVPTVLRNLGTTERASNEIERMGLRFPYPKPHQLVGYLSGLYADSNSIILDSFAGSGTTAHAVLKLNAQDGGNRRFILVEMMDYAETITAERVRRVMSGYGAGGRQTPGLGGGFDYFELGEPLFLDDETLNEAVGAEAIRAYVAHSEGIPLQTRVGSDNPYSPHLLGIDAETAWVFFYDPNELTSLDLHFLAGLNLRDAVGIRPATVIIYADRCLLTKDFLTANGIIFKKIPRDIRRF